MKNLVLTIAIATFTLTSCSKDESFEAVPESSNDLVYMINSQDPSGTFETISSESVASVPANRNSQFSETSGHYEPIFEEPVRLTWNGLQDDYGIYGTAELQIINPAYTIHITMQTECVQAEGNKAVYGGVITQVVQLSGITPPLTPGWKFYFQSTDRDTNLEEGNGADSISNHWIFASPQFESLCSTYTPGHSIWQTNGQYSVNEPGFVNVSDYPQ